MIHIQEFDNYNESFNKSDYNIYKIRFYADGIDVVKGKFDGDENQHQQRAKDYNSLYWELVEKLTGKDWKYYHNTYMMFTIESVNEILKEEYDIRIHGGEEYYWWFIPKELTEISQWIENEKRLPIRKMLRSPNFLSLNDPPSDFFRKKGLEFTEKMKKKFNL